MTKGYGFVCAGRAVAVDFALEGKVYQELKNVESRSGADKGEGLAEGGQAGKDGAKGTKGVKSEKGEETSDTQRLVEKLAAAAVKKDAERSER